MAIAKIKYVGLSDVRIMSKKDLAGAGVGVDGQLRWDRSNGWCVYVEDMSDRLEEVLRTEGAFTIEEVDAQSGKTLKTIVKGQPLDDTGVTVKDGTTGQVSTKGSGS